jgi:hypothetical protein
VTDRGQLILVAGALVAIALAPIVLAYLQLGYHDDVQATAEYDDPTADATRVLDRSVTNASRDLPRDYSWTQRDAAVATVRDRLNETRSQLRTTDITRGTVIETEYNTTAADAWRDDHCPGGPDRQFGDCVVDTGIVIQERVDRTHIVGVAFDLTTTNDRGTTAVTVVFRAVGEKT